VSKLRGWNRIYLFYGLIFFLLGFAACCLNQTFFWEELAWGFQTFTADLGPYTGRKIPSGNPNIMVMAQPNNIPVCFLYTHRLLTKGLAPVLNECRKDLERQCTKLQFKVVTADFDAVFNHWIRENPRSIVIGLNIREPSAGDQTWEIDLKFSVTDLALVPLMERVVEVLRDRPSLTFRLQKKIPGCLEVSWQEAGGAAASSIPTTVGLLLEVLPMRINGHSSFRQL